jgi:UPF0755 protein
MRVPDFFRGILLALALHLARRAYAYLAALIALLLIASVFWAIFLRAPRGFPTGAYLTVPAGATVAQEGRALQAAHVIDSALVFKLLVRAMGAHGIQSGTYAFNGQVGVLRVAWNLAHGISGTPAVRVTIPEGMASTQIASLLAARIPGFDGTAFLAEAKPLEGYLFPDTYFFAPGTSADAAVARMRADYDVHIAPLRERIAAFGKSEREVITMASLLEAEGKTMDERRIIAGILWKRLALGMPLQVDAAFGYAKGMSGYAPTAADLASPSPYNTYRRKGLPPTPIDNPGVDSILAAITPAKTEYLYYLTGTDGKMHYAATLAAHTANEKKYLK